MQFCEEDINWSELFSDFKNIYDKYTQIEDVSPLQGIALANELSEAITTFKDKIEVISFKSIVCAVISQIDLDSEISIIEQKIGEFFSEFSSFDDNITSLNPDDYQSLDDIKSAIAPILDNFEDIKSSIETEMRDGLKIMFQPLIELGATPDQIDEALKDVELSQSPTDLILDTFMSIANSTLSSV